MAGWCIQLLVVSFVLLFASPADAYQLDQFYSFNVTKDQAVVESASSAVQLNGTFRFNEAIKSYISVSLDKLAFFQYQLRIDRPMDPFLCCTAEIPAQYLGRQHVVCTK